MVVFSVRPSIFTTRGAASALLLFNRVLFAFAFAVDVVVMVCKESQKQEKERKMNQENEL